MDISKLGVKTWSEPGLVPLSKEAISGFKKDIQESKVTNSIGDLLELSRSRSQRQFLQQSVSVASLHPKQSHSQSADGLNLGTPQQHMGSIQKKNKHGQAGNVFERPATRLEIDSLSTDLHERIKAVIDAFETTTLITDASAYDPHRDAIALIKDRVLKEFHSTAIALTQEPWLTDLIKCECLRDVCDETAQKLTDMLSVTTTEFGNVLRTLRAAYKQSFIQVRNGLERLRNRHMDLESELAQTKNTVEELDGYLQERDQDMRAKIDAEVFEMRATYEKERAKDRDHVNKVEHQMAEMSVTLRDLNALFKTMQSDADTAIASDTMARCRRLEKEVEELQQSLVQFGKTKEDLHQEAKKNRVLESTVSDLQKELAVLRNTVGRQDETIANLMGREAMHNAEIDKLKKMAAEKAEKDDDLEFDQTATALLCIKCKKALDDLSNIRDAVLGSIKPTEKLMCQNFRILLPNLKGRRPSRDVTWVMRCMRGILTSKMREICALMPYGVAGDVTGFPEFVYAWFDPVITMSSGALGVNGPTASKGTSANSAQARADEDRWGFYYSIKAMSRENMEAKLFWSLLDEAQGEDALAFVMHCLSMALTLGGNELWRQFGETSGYDSVNSLRDTSDGKFDSGDKNKKSSFVPPTIWMQLGAAKQAARLILIRALEPQLHATLEAIDALTEAPDIEHPIVPENENNSTNEIAEGSVDEQSIVKPPLSAGPEPSHVDLFVWLRILLQRFQEEQSHRSAAIRLMFDTASVGALTATPVQHELGDNKTKSDSIVPNTGSESFVMASLGVNGVGGESHVEFPQFLAILRTLYPTMAITEIAGIFGLCYERGERKVTANVLLKVAEMKRLFSRSMKLTVLPLLNRSSPQPTQSEPEVLVLSDNAVAEEDNTLQFNAVEAPDSAVKKEVSFTANDEQMIRANIGAFIHSRAKLIEPEVLKFAKTLPERWRAVLMETFFDLNTAVVDNFNKIKASKRAMLTAERNAGSAMNNYSSSRPGTSGVIKKSQMYIDGLHPYLLYRKVLTLMALFQGLCDNPLLPGDLLSLPAAKASVASRKGFGTAAHQPNGATPDISYHCARSIISSLENAVLSRDFNSTKIAKFETVRKSVSARRIQTAFNKFCNNRDVSIPLTIRTTMRSGYLSYRGPNENAQGLRSRKVYLEPWCAHAAVAETYHFKLRYDRQARRAGALPLDLAKALAASHYNMWGCVELAEISIHDLCQAVRGYMHALPRLRLFAAFLGFSDLDTSISVFLATDVAWTLYMQLILCIHQEINGVILSETEETQDLVNGPIGGLNTTNMGATLFPCLENPLLRPDKRDFWKCDPEILSAAVARWNENHRPNIRDLFTKITQRLPGSVDRDGLMDVDDFLYAIMLQWAKVVSFYAKKIEDSAVRYYSVDNSASDNRPMAVASSKAYFGPPASKWGRKENFNFNADERRIIADLKNQKVPTTFNVGLLMQELYYGPNKDDFEPEYTFSSLDRCAVIGINNIIWGLGNVSNGNIINIDRIARMRTTAAPPALVSAQAPESSGGKATTTPNAVIRSSKPIEPISRAAKGFSQVIQDILLWDMTTASPFSSEPSKSKQSDHFDEKSGGSKIVFQYFSSAVLMQDFQIASAVSATISLWNLTRVWTIYNVSIYQFCQMALSSLQIASLEAGIDVTEKKEEDPKAKAKYVTPTTVDSRAVYMSNMCIDYMKLIEKALGLTSELCQICGLKDPSVTSNSQLNRGASLLPSNNGIIDESTAVESWKLFRELFKLISKISVFLSMQFPIEDATSRSSSRKLQLDKASVYLFQPENPAINILLNSKK